MRRAFAALLLSCMALAMGTTVQGAGPAWAAVAHVPGIFDIGGPRADGWLVVAGSAHLYLVDPAGAVTPYAQGPGGYADDPGAEAYLAVSPGLNTGDPTCNFAPGDVYVLRLHAPIGITNINPAGKASLFTTTPTFKALNGIAFDTVGDFSHHLLVTGTSTSGHPELAAIDCSGSVQVITASAPAMEGGIAVAPRTFGAFGGMLIAPDELSGKIWAISPTGGATLVATSGLPTGGDIGVESAGFVPAGFMAGGTAFYADRATVRNAHLGTDSLLAMSSADLGSAGVQEGDLLVATEGGARLIAVHCAAACSVLKLITADSRAHGEGHIAFTVPKAQPSPSPSPVATSPTPAASPRPVASHLSPAAFAAVIAALVVLGAGVLAVVRVRWRGPGSGSG